MLQGCVCAVLWYPISRIVGELHRVACTDMSSRDPTIGEIDIEQFVHVSHDNHIAIEEDDPLKFYQAKSPEFSPSIRKPCIEIRESVGVWSGL